MADLGLGEVLAEAQTQHELLALGQCVEQPVEGRGGFGGLEAGVFLAQSFPERRCVVRLRRGGTVERITGARVGRFGGVEEFFGCAADVCGELACGRVAPEIIGELFALAFDPDRALLQLARRADRPREVAKVARISPSMVGTANVLKAAP